MALEATGNGPIVFSKTVDGTAALTVTTGGTTTFNGVVGGGVGMALTSLTSNGGGTTEIKTNVTTSGIQTYTEDVVLTGATIVLNSTGVGVLGNIKFEGKLDGNAALNVISGGGTTTFNGVVGGTPLASLRTSGGGTTEIKANVTTSGIQTYTEDVVLTATPILLTSPAWERWVTSSSTANWTATRH